MDRARTMQSFRMSFYMWFQYQVGGRAVVHEAAALHRIEFTLTLPPLSLGSESNHPETARN
jgi:hypothetical protein